MLVGVELLRLSKAAQRLGIPPLTLRTWAIDNVGSLTTTVAGRWYGMRSAQARERLLAETAGGAE
jgi:predicted site-specific integrase-resolvase